VGVVEKKNAGAVTEKVENGTKLKANLNGRNVHCAGEMGVIAVLTVAEQVLSN
jgi:hypothetical protein